MYRTETVDLTAEADRVRDETLAELRERREEIVAEAAAKYDGVEDVPASLQREYQELGEDIAAAEGKARALEHYAGEWGGSEFVISELNADELAYVMDEVASASFDVDQHTQEVDGVPRNGLSMKLTVEQAVDQSPPGAPNDVGQYPSPVLEVLYRRVDRLGTPEDVELKNSSLGDAMAQADASAPNSSTGE
jgi:hypothetical protein